MSARLNSFVIAPGPASVPTSAAIALSPVRVSSWVGSLIALLRSSADADVLHDAPRRAHGRARPHHVEITARITPDAVDGAEARITPLREPLAFERQHAHEPAVVLGNVDNVVAIHVEHRRANELRRPDAQELAVLIEYLHAIVLPVAHEHAPETIDPQPMRKIELAGTRARLAPGEEMRAVGGELVHARIAVPVGDEHLAGRRQRDVGRQVERPAAVCDLLPRA